MCDMLDLLGPGFGRGYLTSALDQKRKVRCVLGVQILISIFGVACLKNFSTIFVAYLVYSNKFYGNMIHLFIDPSYLAKCREVR